ncbi:MAG: YqeG family HAD IIIA-type phosphatase [Anaeroplasmataceae bacterium]
MIEYFFDVKKFIPEEYYTTIYDIDYIKLYEMGKRLILTDLDNTLISYKESMPTKELIDWKNKLEEMGFEIIICSNNKKLRVSSFSNNLGLKYVYSAKKPLKCGLKKAIKKASRKYNRDEIVEIGDQIMTDQFGSKRMKLYTIMVKNIDPKTEIWTTRFNRRIENRIIKRIMNKYPSLYKEKLQRYVSEKIAG